MVSDLSALLPPLLVCAAFVVGVVVFLRHEMRRGGDGSGGDASDSGEPENQPPDSGTTGHQDSFGPAVKTDYQPPGQGADGRLR
jgi:hypothetical protein